MQTKIPWLLNHTHDAMSHTSTTLLYSMLLYICFVGLDLPKRKHMLTSLR